MMISSIIGFITHNSFNLSSDHSSSLSDPPSFWLRFSAPSLYPVHLLHMLLPIHRCWSNKYLQRISLLCYLCVLMTRFQFFIDLFFLLVPTMPLQLRAIRRNDTILRIKWTKPDRLNGLLIGYNISWTHINRTYSDRTNETEYEITELGM